MPVAPLFLELLVLPTSFQRQIKEIKSFDIFFVCFSQGTAWLIFAMRNVRKMKCRMKVDQSDIYTRKRMLKWHTGVSINSGL